MTEIQVSALVVAIVAVYAVGFGVFRALIDPHEWEACNVAPWPLLAAWWPVIAIFWVPVKLMARAAALGGWLTNRVRRVDGLPRATAKERR